MTIHLRRNQYRGINAHLHSHFQRNRGWTEFHQAHIRDIASALKKALHNYPEYTVHIVPSLQRAHYDLYSDAPPAQPTEKRPISMSAEPRDLSDIAALIAKPTVTLPIINLFLEDQEISAVIVNFRGSPITRIELISPASKPSGSHHRQYIINRSQALSDLVQLVEVDYLHERRPLISDLTDYYDPENGASPYVITVGRMFSPTGPGEIQVYGFNVEDPIPAVPIPLYDNDILTFDFNMVYHHTFVENTLNGMRLVDYAALPEGFESYNSEDQSRIKRRMELIAEQHGTHE